METGEGWGEDSSPEGGNLTSNPGKGDGHLLLTRGSSCRDCGWQGQASHASCGFRTAHAARTERWPRG